MKISLLLKTLLCLNLLFFVQFAEAQNKISEKISQNLPQLQNTTLYTPLETVTTDELKSRIPDEVLSRKQFFQVRNQSIQSIKTNNSEYLRISVPIEGQDIELQLYRADIFTDNFRAELTSNPNENLEIDRGVHYRGIVADDPNSLATISFIGNEIVGGIHYNDKQMSLAKLRDDDYHILFENKNLNHTLDFACQVLPTSDSQLSSEIDQAVEKSSSLLDCVGVHIEVDQSFYQQQGSDWTATSNYVNALFAQVTMMFANENIPVAISFMRIWNTPDPYGAGTELDDLRSQAYGTTNGNIVHLLHGQGGGGVAYLGGLCDNILNVAVSGIYGFFNNVPTYSWDVMVVTHEIGHNLGSSHTHDCVWNGNGTQLDDCGNKAYDEDSDTTTNPQPCYNNTNQIIPPNGGTVMSYCHLLGGVGINLALGFGQQPGDQIRAFTASRNCGDFCFVACPTQVILPYARTEDVCAGIATYTFPTSYPGLVVDNSSAAIYEWSIGNYISAGGTPLGSATTYTLANPPSCDPVTQQFYLNTGCFTDNLNDMDAGILTLNIYPDPEQFTAADLVTVSGENTCDAPLISPNCASVTVSPDPANPTFPVSGAQSGTANYIVSYTPQAGTPNCCIVDASGELLTNGDFEANPPQTGWTEIEEVPAGTPNPNPFGVIGVSNSILNGTNDAWLGGRGGTSYIAISQDIYISPTCSTAELTFDLGMSCANGGITLSLEVNGVIVGSLGCTDQYFGSILPYDLIAAGAPTGNVTFTIIGEEDGTGSDAPDIYVDNVSILTTGCTTPIVCDFPVSATYDCQQTCAGVDLDINFDNTPGQTSWEIIDTSNGSTVASGGTYNSQAANSNLNLPAVTCLPDGCYELNFYDTVNNGMCPFRAVASSSGTFITPGTLISTGAIVATLGTVVTPGLCGNYTLTDVNGATLASGGGSFGSSESTTFCLSGGTAQLWQPDNDGVYAKQQQPSTGLKIFPTLTSNDLFVYTPEMSEGQINIVDMNGQIIQQYQQNALEMQLNVSELPAGIYFVQMIANDSILVEKFVKK